MVTSTTSETSPTSGALVRVTDENCKDLGIAIYLYTVVPRDEGMDELDLLAEQQWIDTELFHVIPHISHYRVLMCGRTLHLSTRGFTLLHIGSSDEVDSV